MMYKMLHIFFYNNSAELNFKNNMKIKHLIEKKEKLLSKYFLAVHNNLLL